MATDCHTKREMAKGNVILFKFSIILGALTIAVGLCFFVRGLLRLSTEPDEFWGWVGGGLGCVLGGLWNIRGTVRSFRRIEGARELLLAIMLREIARRNRNEQIRRQLGVMGWLKTLSKTSTGAPVEEGGSLPLRPDWSGENRRQIRRALIGLLCLAGFLLTLAATVGTFVVLGWWLLWSLVLYLPMLFLGLAALALLLEAAAYPAGRLLVAGVSDDKDGLPAPAPVRSPGALPPGMGPRILVVSIGSLIGSVLILGGSWARGASPDFSHAFWAGLATGISGILGGWPAMIGRPSRLVTPSRPFLARIRGQVRRLFDPRRTWGGWETVMEDPGFNWFDALTAVWIAVGLVSLFLPFWLVRLGVALPLALKHTYGQLAVTFVIQGALFVFVRFSVRAGDARTSAREIWGQLGWCSAVTFYVTVFSLMGLIAFMLRFSNVPTLALVRDIEGKKVHAVAISPDDRLALTSQEDGTVRLWDLETGVETRRFIVWPDGGPRHYWLHSVAFSPDGKLALAGAGKQVYVWDIDTGQKVRELDGGGHVYCVSPNSKQVVTDLEPNQQSADDGQAWLALRELATGKVIRRFAAGMDAAFSSDGRQLLAGSGDGVSCWDLDSGLEIHHWAMSSGIRRVSFVPGCKQAAAIDGQGAVYLWDIGGGGPIRTLRGPGVHTLFGTEPGTCRAAVFAGGRRAAVLYAHFWPVGGDSFRLYDLERGERIYVGDLPTDQGTVLAGTPDGRRLLASTPFKLNLWSLPKRSP